ncbi:MAG: IS1182 family transposase [Bacteroidales bacterium]
MNHYIQSEDRNEIQIRSLDCMVNLDNPVRLIDYLINRIIANNPDKFNIKGQSHTGRRAYSPLTMIKLFVYGYLHRIPSSRRLERECHINIELQWLLGNLRPDFKTIADFRKDNAEAFQSVKVEFRKMLVEMGMISSSLVAIDGTKIKANASNTFYKAMDINELLKKSELEMQQYLNLMHTNDVLNEAEATQSSELRMSDIEQRIKELEANISKLKELQLYSELNAGIGVNPVDQDSRRMLNHGKTEAAFNVQIAVDDKHHLIVADEVLQDANDKNGMKPVLTALRNELGIEPDKAVMDMGYINAVALQEMERDSSTDLYVVTGSVSPGQTTDTAFNKWVFTYNSDNDTYTCPAGQTLVRRGGILQCRKRKSARYFCPKSICIACEYKSCCIKGESGRSLIRYTDEEWMEEFNNRMKSTTSREILNRRKAIVEHVFGTLKRWMGYQPLLLRGLIKVRTEISLYTIGYNLRRVLNIGIPGFWLI